MHKDENWYGESAIYVAAIGVDLQSATHESTGATRPPRPIRSPSRTRLPKGGLKIVQDLKASALAKKYVAPQHGKGG